MAEIVILITTYRRADMLMELLKSLEDVPCKIKVYDDGSGSGYEKVSKYLKQRGHDYITMPFNYGKRNYWKLHSVMYNDLRNEEFSYLIQLPDDMLPVKGLYPKIVNQFKECGGSLLNPVIGTGLSEAWEKEGVKFIEVNGNRYWEKDWFECFITTKDYLEKINYSCPQINPKRWDRNPDASSGVGRMLSTTYKNAGGDIRVVDKSLLFHRGKVSYMNPNRERMITHKF